MESNQEIQIACASGIRARLLGLEQHSTYRDLLDGTPTHELNERLLSHIGQIQGRIPTYLVRPVETFLEGRGGRDHSVVVLPERQCTGLFEAGTHRLQIVWFQDGWAPPIDSVVLEELTSLDFMAIGFDDVSTW